MTGIYPWEDRFLLRSTTTKRMVCRVIAMAFDTNIAKVLNRIPYSHQKKKIRIHPIR